MSINYSAIARGSRILCSHEELSKNNYKSLVSNILPNIPVGTNGKISYKSDSNMTVNVLVDNGLTYICVCSQDVDMNRRFEFLNEVKRSFTSTSLTHRAMHAGEHEFDREFGATLISIVDNYKYPMATNGGGGHMTAIQMQVEEVKGVMVRNIEAVMERGQKLEDLLAMSKELEQSASSFQKTARKVKRKMWWQNTRMMIVLIISAVIFVFLLIIIVLFSVHILPVRTDGTTTTTTTTTTAFHP